MLPWIFGLALFCLVLERVIPGWRLPRIKTWPARVIAVNLVQLVVVFLAGLTWEKWLSSASLFHLGQALPAWAGGPVAYFIATFVFYWWHRVRHTNDFLWLHFHQIHHSPRRLEVITSFYKHPVEMIINSVIGSLLVYTVLGLSPEAGAVYTFFTAAGEFFYHTNVKTPRWIGFFFQRPEMHRIHHKYGYHKNNYGDIPWWDMLFGTFENPKTFDATCGFDAEKEEELGRMLRFKDVHRPVALTLVAALTAFTTQNTDACTSFRTLTSDGHVLMAKNYDWAIADGYVVALPKGQQRTALQVLKPRRGEEPFQWTSRYGSLAFTQFGIGVAIGGMNDQGLAIETLVNTTGAAGSGREDVTRLVSLQWVQYQLDTARDVAEVVSSLETVAPLQYLMPVHFLACDRKGACAVIETDTRGRAVVTKQQSTASEPIVLANRDYRRDAKDAKVKKSWLPSLSLETSSVSRFREASKRLAGKSRIDVKSTFDLLDDVRMPLINRWQIVWDLTAGEARWVNRDGRSSDEDYASFNLRDLPAACEPNKVLTARLGAQAFVASPLATAPRSRIDARLSQLFDESLTLVELRKGESMTKDVKARIRDAAKGRPCQ